MPSKHTRQLLPPAAWHHPARAPCDTCPAHPCAHCMPGHGTRQATWFLRPCPAGWTLERKSRSEGRLTPTQEASKIPLLKWQGCPPPRGYPKCLLRGDGEGPACTGWFGHGLRPSVLSHAHWLPPLGPSPSLLQWLRKTSPMSEELKRRHGSRRVWLGTEVFDCWSGHTPRFRSLVGARVRGN